MADADLVDGEFGLAGNSAIVATTGLVTANVTVPRDSLAQTKLTPAQSFVVYAESGINYYQILPIAQVQTGPAYTYKAVGMTPIQAFGMDSKLDDGMPNSVVVRAKGIAAVNGNASFAAGSTANTYLMTGATATDPTDTYNRVSSTGGSDASCSLRFRFN